MSEFDERHNRISSLLRERKLDALLLQRVSSFAWATCGAASYVNTATSDGAASLLITPAGRYVITNNIEATRLEQEEKLSAQGWELRLSPWHKHNDAVAELTRDLRLGADAPIPGATDLSGELARLRASLTPEEGERFRALGRICAKAMNTAARSIRPGLTEYEIAGMLARASESLGAQAIVNLIATDERIFRFRHPLPTDKILDRYAMLVLCGRKWGLVASITRLVHFGRLPDEVKRKAEACARVDATLIAATRPGRTLADIFHSAVNAYAETGFTDEWQLHHQGGPAAYEPREYIATLDSTEKVALGQACAWNPSITGTKSEDTILVGAAENEVLTAIDGWPLLPVMLWDGRTLARPAILEVV
jgi:Xaa-Pro aminopeptidase